MEDYQENGFTETQNERTENPRNGNMGDYQQNYAPNADQYGQQRQPYPPYNNYAEPVPYGVTSLVLGICSVFFGSVCIGLVCGIIGLVLGNRGLNAYRLDPGRYRGYGMLNAGRILSIIGIIFSSLMVVFWILFVMILGVTAGCFLNCWL